MKFDRRQVLYAAGTAVCAALVPGSMAAATPQRRRAPQVGMTAWNLGSTADPARIPVAASVGLDGAQNDLICEVHIKEMLGLADPNVRLLGAPAAGGVDFPAVAAACRDIGYDKW
jgi:hypothetical protein